MPNERVIKGARNLVVNCACIKPGEKVLIICDNTTYNIGLIVEKIVREITPHVNNISVPPFNIHGEEPPHAVAEHMCDSDIIFGLTESSMAHTEARMKASEKGARYLSLPEYSFDVLSSPALFIDFKNLTKEADEIAGELDRAREIHLTSEGGTDLVMDITGRSANSCPGWLSKPGSLASPPDAETNIAPLENRSFGNITVDGSIPHPHIGLVRNPFFIEINEGRIEKISGTDASRLEEIFSNYCKEDNADILAEFGIGLNPSAQLCGRMLEDEGCRGTVHLGFGSNSTIGGSNKVSFHIDIVIKNASYELK